MVSEREPVQYQLRPELEYSYQTHQGEPVTVVKDTVRDRYFRFSGAQASIVELLRTATDLETLSTQASARVGAEIPPSTLARFLDSLESKLLLDTPAVHANLDNVSGDKTADRNWLYVRVLSLNAEALFNWLSPRVTWAFTPVFHAFAVAIILTGLIITTIHARSLVSDALNLLNLYGIVVIWFVVIGVGSLHELAHGLTCRHFGGKVKELGFMLIYFQPAFYCDVSDSWMFPNRRDRMWVTFAGGYFQLVIWGLAAIAWRIFAQDALINWIAMIVLVFSGLQTLVNFNPLIKLDGYYMLSDYLEIPNLRVKALQAVRSWISGAPDPLLKSTNRRSLLTFGVISLTFSTLLLTIVYVNIYLLATSYFAFAGVALFILFAGFTLRRTGAEPAAGARALVTRASLHKYRNLAILVGLLVLTFIVPWKLRIPAGFTIRPGAEFQVRATTDGTVDEILVGENDHVHRGQEIAYLYNAELRERHTVLQGQYESRNAELARMESPPRPEERDRLQQLVRTRQQALENVRRNEQTRIAMERELDAQAARVETRAGEAEALVQAAEEGLVPKQDALTAQGALEEAEALYAAMEANIRAFDETNDAEEDLKRNELEEARGELALLDAGTRSDEIEQVRNETYNLFAQLMDISQELDAGTIKAEISGIVVTPDLELLEGATLTAGDLLMVIQSVETVSAELLVSEKDLADVEIGQPIALVANSYANRIFHGRVDRIAQAGQVVDGQTFVRVTSQLANEDGALRTDMTGHAKIDAGWYSIFHLMTRRLVRWIRTEFWHLIP